MRRRSLRWRWRFTAAVSALTVIATGLGGGVAQAANDPAQTFGEVTAGVVEGRSVRDAVRLELPAAPSSAAEATGESAEAQTELAEPDEVTGESAEAQTELAEPDEVTGESAEAQTELAEPVVATAEGDSDLVDEAEAPLTEPLAAEEATVLESVLLDAASTATTYEPSYWLTWMKGSSVVYGRGLNSVGFLGDGTTTDRPTPVIVSPTWGSRKVEKLKTSGWGSTSILADDGTVWSWGRNDLGQLGDGTLSNSSKPVQTKPSWGSRKIIDIFGANGRTIAIANDGTLWQWGYLQSDDGTNSKADKPSQMNTTALGSRKPQVKSLPSRAGR